MYIIACDAYVWMIPMYISIYTYIDTSQRYVNGRYAQSVAGKI